MINFKRFSRDCPPAGSGINWGHPLAQNLVGAWLFNIQSMGIAAPGVASPGYVPSLINRNDDFQSANGHTNSLYMPPVVMPDRGGIGFSGLQAAGDSSSIPYMQLLAPSAALTPTDFLSTFWGGVPMANQVGSNHPAIFADESADLSYGFTRFSSNNTQALFFYNIAGTAHTPIVSNCFPTYGVWTTLGQSLKSGSQKSYASGRLVNTDTFSGALTYSSPKLLVNTNHQGGLDHSSTECAQCFHQVIYVWHRMLTDDEHLQLFWEPFSLIDWRMPRIKFFFGKATPPPAFLPYTDMQYPQLMPQ